MLDCISSWLITVICGLGYLCCLSIELCADKPPFFDGEYLSSNGPLLVPGPPLIPLPLLLGTVPVELLLPPCRWSQCRTTVTRPLLSMIFQDGVSSWSSRACIVSQTIFGIADIAASIRKKKLKNNYVKKTVKYCSSNIVEKCKCRIQADRCGCVLNHSPALITSTPDGYHRSPCLKSNRTVLFANVRKYSPSSICVPSHSKTTRTGSEAGTPSLSLPTRASTSIQLG